MEGLAVKTANCSSRLSLVCRYDGQRSNTPHFH